jgi:hypothetical protein
MTECTGLNRGKSRNAFRYGQNRVWGKVRLVVMKYPAMLQALRDE